MPLTTEHAPHAASTRSSMHLDAPVPEDVVETPRAHRRRTLLLLAKRPASDLRQRISAGEEPRAEYLELAARLNAELVDFHDVDRATHPLVRFARRLGPRWGLAALGALRHREFDDIYATGEDVGIPLAMMLRARRVHDKLTVVVHCPDTPKRRRLLRAIGDSVFRFVITLNEAQARVLTQSIGFTPAKVRRLDYWLDQEFYRPIACAEEEFVLSVGMESRDYDLLQRVASALPYRFQVIASGWSPNAGFAAAAGIQDSGNITIERGVSAARLRHLYASARFVVVPLKSVSYAAGVTTILEAMAMGKAVVTTDSPGIRDYIVDGVSAQVAPCGDSNALRSAIERLWGDPAALQAAGRHNRGWIEQKLNMDRYVASVHELLAPSPRTLIDTSRPAPLLAGSSPVAIPNAVPTRNTSDVNSSPFALRVEVVTTEAGLDALGAEWRALFDRIPDALPFASHEWAVAWWTHLRRTGRPARDALRVFVVRTLAGEALAFAPFLRTEYRVLGVPVIRILQPIGADRYLTEIRGMLVAAEHEPWAVAALAAHLRDHPQRIDSIRWGGLRRNGSAFAMLAGQPDAIVDWEMSTFPLPLADTWDEFRRTRPRNLKESLRKCYNSLARDGHEWRFHALKDGEEVLGALDRFFDLHGRRAGADTTISHPNYFASPRERRFLADVVERFGRRGIARMFQLEIGGEIVAMRLGFRFGNNLYLYYSGYDPEWGRYSVMTTVVAETIRHAIETGVRVVNLSSGSDVSKTRWRPDETAYVHAIVPAAGVRARLAHRAFFAASDWRSKRRKPDETGASDA